MNILCVEQFANLGGGQRSLLDLIPSFLARGWQVALGAPGPGALVEAAAGLGCAVVDLECGSYSQEHKPLAEMVRYALESVRLSKVIGRIVESRHIDVIYVNGPRFLPPAAWVARRKSLPLIFHCHNRLFQRAAVALTGESLRFSASTVIGCCEYSVEPLRRYVKEPLIQIIYNGVRPPARDATRVTGKLKRIGVIGRIEKEKGQLEFLCAARMIASEIRDCTFVVVGAPMFGGTSYYDRVVAASAGLPVEFVGWQKDVFSVLSGLDLLVVPSLSLDSLPRVIFEAFAARVPVVAFPSGGIPEIVRDGITGFQTRNATAEALAERILSLAQQSPDLMEQVTARAYAAWEQNHTLELYQYRVCQVLANHSDTLSPVRRPAAALELSQRGER